MSKKPDFVGLVALENVAERPKRDQSLMQAESVSPNDQTQESPENSPTKVTAPTSGPISPSIAATAPGQIRVIKRNGTVVPYAED